MPKMPKLSVRLPRPGEEGPFLMGAVKCNHTFSGGSSGPLTYSHQTCPRCRGEGFCHGNVVLESIGDTNDHPDRHVALRLDEDGIDVMVGRAAQPLCRIARDDDSHEAITKLLTALSIPYAEGEAIEPGDDDA